MDVIQFSNYRALRGAGMPARRAINEARRLAGWGVEVLAAWPASASWSYTTIEVQLCGRDADSVGYSRTYGW